MAEPSAAPLAAAAAASPVRETERCGEGADPHNVLSPYLRHHVAVSSAPAGQCASFRSSDSSAADRLEGTAVASSSSSFSSFSSSPGAALDHSFSHKDDALFFHLRGSYGFSSAEGVAAASTSRGGTAAIQSMTRGTTFAVVSAVDSASLRIVPAAEAAASTDEAAVPLAATPSVSSAPAAAPVSAATPSAAQPSAAAPVASTAQPSAAASGTASPSSAAAASTASPGAAAVCTAQPSAAAAASAAAASTVQPSAAAAGETRMLRLTSSRPLFLRMTAAEAVRAYVLLQQPDSRQEVLEEGGRAAAAAAAWPVGRHAAAATARLTEEERRLQEAAATSLALKLSSNTLHVLDLLQLLRPFLFAAAQTQPEQRQRERGQQQQQESGLQQQQQKGGHQQQEEGGVQQQQQERGERFSSADEEEAAGGGRAASALDQEGEDDGYDDGEEKESSSIGRGPAGDATTAAAAAHDICCEETNAAAAAAEAPPVQSYAARAQRKTRAAALLAELLHRVPQLSLQSPSSRHLSSRAAGVAAAAAATARDAAAAAATARNAAVATATPDSATATTPDAAAATADTAAGASARGARTAAAPATAAPATAAPATAVPATAAPATATAAPAPAAAIAEAAATTAAAATAAAVVGVCVACLKDWYMVEGMCRALLALLLHHGAVLRETPGAACRAASSTAAAAAGRQRQPLGGDQVPSQQQQQHSVLVSHQQEKSRQQQQLNGVHTQAEGEANQQQQQQVQGDVKNALVRQQQEQQEVVVQGDSEGVLESSSSSCRENQKYTSSSSSSAAAAGDSSNAVTFIARGVLQQVHAPSFPQPGRQMIFELLLLLLCRFQQDMQQLLLPEEEDKPKQMPEDSAAGERSEARTAAAGEEREKGAAAVDVVAAICNSIEGERDPRCLLLAFDIIKSVGRDYSSLLQQDDVEALVDVLMEYFPISFSPPLYISVPVTEPLLRQSFHEALSASPLFAPFVLLYLLDTLAAAEEAELQQCLQDVAVAAAAVLPKFPAAAVRAALKPLHALLLQFCDDSNGCNTHAAALAEVWGLFLRRALQQQEREEAPATAAAAENEGVPPTAAAAEMDAVSAAAAAEREGVPPTAAAGAAEMGAVSAAAAAEIGAVSGAAAAAEMGAVSAAAAAEIGAVSAAAAAETGVVSTSTKSEEEELVEGEVKRDGVGFSFSSWLEEEVEPLLQQLLSPLLDAAEPAGGPAAAAAQQFLLRSSAASPLACRCCLQICLLPLLQECVERFAVLGRAVAAASSSHAVAAVCADRRGSRERETGEAAAQQVGEASDEEEVAVDLFGGMHVREGRAAPPAVEKEWVTAAALRVASGVRTAELFLTVSISQQHLTDPVACPTHLAGLLLLRLLQVLQQLGFLLLQNTKGMAVLPRLLLAIGQVAALPQQHPTLAAYAVLQLAELLGICCSSATCNGCCFLQSQKRTTCSSSSTPCSSSSSEGDEGVHLSSSSSRRDSWDCCESGIYKGENSSSSSSSVYRDSSCSNSSSSKIGSAAGSHRRRKNVEDRPAWVSLFAAVQRETQLVRPSFASAWQQQIAAAVRLHGLRTVLQNDNISPLLQVLRPLQQALLGNCRLATCCCAVGSACCCSSFASSCCSAACCCCCSSFCSGLAQGLEGKRTALQQQQEHGGEAHVEEQQADDSSSKENNGYFNAPEALQRVTCGVTHLLRVGIAAAAEQTAAAEMRKAAAGPAAAAISAAGAAVTPVAAATPAARAAALTPAGGAAAVMPAAGAAVGSEGREARVGEERRTAAKSEAGRAEVTDIGNGQCSKPPHEDGKLLLQRDKALGVSVSRTAGENTSEKSSPRGEDVSSQHTMKKQESIAAPPLQQVLPPGDTVLGISLALCSVLLAWSSPCCCRSSSSGSKQGCCCGCCCAAALDDMYTRVSELLLQSAAAGALYCMQRDDAYQKEQQQKDSAEQKSFSAAVDAQVAAAAATLRAAAECLEGALRIRKAYQIAAVGGYDWQSQQQQQQQGNVEENAATGECERTENGITFQEMLQQLLPREKLLTALQHALIVVFFLSRSTRQQAAAVLSAATARRAAAADGTVPEKALQQQQSAAAVVSKTSGLCLSKEGAVASRSSTTASSPAAAATAPQQVWKQASLCDVAAAELTFYEKYNRPLLSTLRGLLLQLLQAMSAADAHRLARDIFRAAAGIGKSTTTPYDAAAERNKGDRASAAAAIPAAAEECTAARGHAEKAAGHRRRSNDALETKETAAVDDISKQSQLLLLALVPPVLWFLVSDIAAADVAADDAADDDAAADDAAAADAAADATAAGATSAAGAAAAAAADDRVEIIHASSKSSSGEGVAREPQQQQQHGSSKSMSKVSGVPSSSSRAGERTQQQQQWHTRREGAVTETVAARKEWNEHSESSSSSLRDTEDGWTVTEMPLLLKGILLLCFQLLHLQQSDTPAAIETNSTTSPQCVAEGRSCCSITQPQTCVTHAAAADAAAATEGVATDAAAAAIEAATAETEAAASVSPGVVAVHGQQTIENQREIRGMSDGRGSISREERAAMDDRETEGMRLPMRLVLEVVAAVLVFTPREDVVLWLLQECDSFRLSPLQERQQEEEQQQQQQKEEQQQQEEAQQQQEGAQQQPQKEEQQQQQEEAQRQGEHLQQQQEASLQWQLKEQKKLSAKNESFTSAASTRRREKKKYKDNRGKKARERGQVYEESCCDAAAAKQGAQQLFLARLKGGTTLKALCMRSFYWGREQQQQQQGSAAAAAAQPVVEGLLVSPAFCRLLDICLRSIFPLAAAKTEERQKKTTPSTDVTELSAAARYASESSNSCRPGEEIVTLYAALRAVSSLLETPAKRLQQYVVEEDEVGTAATAAAAAGTAISTACMPQAGGAPAVSHSNNAKGFQLFSDRCVVLNTLRLLPCLPPEQGQYMRKWRRRTTAAAAAVKRTADFPDAAAEAVVARTAAAAGTSAAGTAGAAEAPALAAPGPAAAAAAAPVGSGEIEASTRVDVQCGAALLQVDREKMYFEESVGNSEDLLLHKTLRGSEPGTAVVVAEQQETAAAADTEHLHLQDSKVESARVRQVTEPADRSSATNQTSLCTKQQEQQLWQQHVKTPRWIGGRSSWVLGRHVPAAGLRFAARSILSVGKTTLKQLQMAVVAAEAEATAASSEQRMLCNALAAKGQAAAGTASGVPVGTLLHDTECICHKSRGGKWLAAVAGEETEQQMLVYVVQLLPQVVCLAAAAASLRAEEALLFGIEDKETHRGVHSRVAIRSHEEETAAVHIQQQRPLQQRHPLYQRRGLLATVVLWAVYCFYDRTSIVQKYFQHDRRSRAATVPRRAVRLYPLSAWLCHAAVRVVIEGAGDCATAEEVNELRSHHRRGGPRTHRQFRGLLYCGGAGNETTDTGSSEEKRNKTTIGEQGDAVFLPGKRSVSVAEVSRRCTKPQKVGESRERKGITSRGKTGVEFSAADRVGTQVGVTDARDIAAKDDVVGSLRSSLARVLSVELMTALEEAEHALLTFTVCLLLLAQRWREQLRSGKCTDMVESRSFMVGNNNLAGDFTGFGDESKVQSSSNSNKSSKLFDRNAWNSSRNGHDFVRHSGNTRTLQDEQLLFLEQHREKILLFLVTAAQKRCQPERKYGLLREDPGPLLRVLALQAINNYAALPSNLFSTRLRQLVIVGVQPALDDPHRLVRRAAAVCRNRWSTLE